MALAQNAPSGLGAALESHRDFLAQVRERQRARRAVLARASASSSSQSRPNPSSHPNPKGPTPSQSRTHSRTHSLTNTSTRASSSALSPAPTSRPPTAAANGQEKAEREDRSLANVANYVPKEEAVRNDYAAWYACSGQWPSNYVLGAGDGEICDEFPALRRLMDLKAAHVAATAHPPLIAPLPSFAPSSLLPALAPHRFDVILLHDPRSWGGSWADVSALPIRHLSADPAFVFLWVGSGDSDGLERGRECLAKWGFRRAEDIVWVKTNRVAAGAARSSPSSPSQNGDAADQMPEKRNPGGASSGLFASQKEHCLMGIRGTVRRSTDVHFVHCNVDTDVIVWEDDKGTGRRIPPYLYTLVENFCLGARRLELFGDASLARPGWVTAPLVPDTASTSSLGLALTTPGPCAPTLESMNAPPGAERFDSNAYPLHLPRKKEEGKPVVPFHAEIEMLRPKSPQRRGGRKNGGGGAPHGGGGMGGPHSGGSGPSSPPPGAHTPRFGQGLRMGALTPAHQPHGQMKQGMQGMGQPSFQQMAMANSMANNMGMNPMAMMGMGGHQMMFNPMEQMAMLQMGVGMDGMGQGMGMGQVGQMGPAMGMGHMGHMGQGMGMGMGQMGHFDPAMQQMMLQAGSMPMGQMGQMGGMGGMGMGGMGGIGMVSSPSLSPHVGSEALSLPGSASPDPNAIANSPPPPVDEWGNPVGFYPQQGYQQQQFFGGGQGGYGSQGQGHGTYGYY